MSDVQEPPSSEANHAGQAEAGAPNSSGGTGLLDVEPPLPWPLIIVTLGLAIGLLSGLVGDDLGRATKVTGHGEVLESVNGVVSFHDGMRRFLRDPFTPAMRLLPIPVLTFVMVIPACIMWPFVGLVFLIMTPFVWFLQGLSASHQLADRLVSLFQKSAPVLGLGVLAVCAGLVLDQHWAMRASRLLIYVCAVSAGIALITGRSGLAAAAASYVLVAWWVTPEPSRDG